MVMGSLLRPAFCEKHVFNTHQTESIQSALMQIVAASWGANNASEQVLLQDDGATNTPLLNLIQDFLLSNLGETNLSPQVIADSHRISVRHLHRLFAAVGTTHGEWLRGARLERCAADLRDGTQSASNITEIAFRWGFNESAHFSRSFKAHFGASPREYRTSFFSNSARDRQPGPSRHITANRDIH